MPQNTQKKKPRKPFGKSKTTFDPNAPIRVRLPKDYKREVIAIVEEHFGSRFRVRCMDGFTRICRVPGKIRYKLYLRPGDVILITKWSVQGDEKCDYAYKYRRAQIQVLRQKGLLTEKGSQPEPAPSKPAESPTAPAPAPAKEEQEINITGEKAA